MKRLVFIFLFFSLGAFALLLTAPGLLCPDGFYHMKIAQIISGNFPYVLKSFPWLNFTILRDYFTDHHFLFHILASFFVKISPFLGMKIFISLIIGLFFVSFYFLLKTLKIQYSLFYTLLLLTSSDFFFRLLPLRAISFSLLFLFIGFYFLYKRNYFWLLVLSFFFVWSYGGFFTILATSFIFFISYLFLEKYKEWQPIFFTLGGIIFGIVINPFFPKNLEFFKIQNIKIPFLNGIISNVIVSEEWYPPEFISLIKGNFLIWLIFCGILAVLIWYRRDWEKFKEKVSTEGLSAILLSGFFFLLTVRSQRFVEYWVPFTVLAGALVARDFEIDKNFTSWIENSKSPQKNMRSHIFLRFLHLATFTIFLVAIFANSINSNYLSLKNTPPYDRYKPSAEWLQKNTPEKSIVFNVSWDDFPEIFFWNTHNYYIVGMDPTFMYEYDKNLYEKWQKVGSGEDPKPSETVKKYFSSQLIFTNKEKSEEFLKIASADPDLEKSYEDQWVVIYKVKAK